MARITLQGLGIKASHVNNHTRKPGKRGECVGWSMQAARRNADFLRSINPDRLTEGGLVGYLFTLTLRDRPATSDDWSALRERLCDAFRKHPNFVRLHWVCEWQPRPGDPLGPCPHLHGIAYFKANNVYDEQWSHGWVPSWLPRRWLDLAAAHRPSDIAQDVRQIRDTGASWIVYMAKHGSRGIVHLQRCKQLPLGWDKSGRMWGKSGDWPIVNDQFEVTKTVFVRFRRFVLRYRLSQARQELRRAKGSGNLSRLSAARSSVRWLSCYLQRPQDVSKWLPITEWIDPDLARRWLDGNVTAFDDVDQWGEVHQVHQMTQAHIKVRA